MKQLSVVIFSVWLLLFVILGDSYLSYYFFSSGILLQLWLFLKYQKKELSFETEELLFFMFAIVLAISSMFTVSLPRTLYEISSFGLAFLSFFVFKQLDFKLINKQKFLKLFELIGAVLVLIAIGLQYFPEGGNLLPGFNLIYASYGHNHIAAYLLLIFPFSWWNFFQDDKDKVVVIWVKSVVPIILTLGLLLSFGRVAIFLGFIEFLILAWSYRKRGKKQKNFEISNIISTVVFLFFVASIIFKIYLSVAPIVDPDYRCPFNKMEKQLCKSFGKEPRLKYWAQALRMTKDNYLTGTGPGTYSVMIKKYIVDANYLTAHAHNFYLRKIAELGIIGGVGFFFFMGGLLYFSYKKISGFQLRKHMQLEASLLIGVFAIYIDNFFDYDWHYNGIFLLTIIFLALVLNRSELKIGSSDCFKLWGKKYLKKFFYFFWQLIIVVFFAWVLVLSLLFLATNQLINKGEITSAFNLFPFFHWHGQIYAKSEHLSETQTSKLTKIYYSESRVLNHLLLKEEDKKKSLQLQQRLSYLEPWLTTSLSSLNHFLATKQVDEAEAELTRLDQIIDLGKERGFEHQITSTLNQKRIDLAYLLFELGRYQQAGELIVKSQKRDVWILDRQDQIILQDKKMVSDQITFFLEIEKIPAKYFGSFQDEYADYLLNLAILRIEKNEFFYLEKLIEKMINLKANKKYDIKEKLIPLLILNLNEISPPTSDDVDNLILLINTCQNCNCGQLPTEATDDIERILQKWADEMGEVGNFYQAEQLLATMALFSPDKYWTRVQLGNFYIKYQQLDLAEKFFKDCLNAFDNEHKDCLIGLRSIENGAPNYERYDQVKQIILNEKKWQDFSD